MEKSVSKNWLLAILIIAACAIVAAAYWPVLSAKALSFDDGLFLDDDSPLVQNPGWALVGRTLTEVLDPSVIPGYYQPLPVLSMMADYWMGGSKKNLAPFHWTSLAIHIFNTALVIVLLYRLFGQPIPAALTGLLFGVHPLTVEPVAWISDRKTILSMFFVLWSLIFYVRFAQKGGLKFYFASIGTYVLGLMSKPASIPVPLLMLVLDYWPLNRLKTADPRLWSRVTSHKSRAIILEKLPFFVLGGVFAFITIISNTRNLEMPLSAKLAGTAQLLRTFLTVCYLIIFYLRKIFWPVNLSSVYLLPNPLSLSNWAVATAVFGTFVLSALLLFSVRRSKALPAGCLFFFLAVLPMLGIVPFSGWVVASDKYVYTPMVGLLLVLAWVLTEIWKSGRYGSTAAKAVLVVLLLFLSSIQIYCLRRYLAHWRDTVSLFEYMLTLTPDAEQLHNNLGIELQSLGRNKKAISHFQQALKLNYDYIDAHNNLGLSLQLLGRIDEAIDEYQKAIRLKPNYSLAYNNLGSAFITQGKFNEAIEKLAQALKIRSDYADAHYNMGKVLQLEGRAGEAISEYNQALKIRPDYPAAHTNIVDPLLAQKRYSEAVSHLRKALQSDPNFAGALNNLAWIMATVDDSRIRNPAEAVRLAEKACKLDKDEQPDFLDTLAAAYAAAGRFDQAVPAAEKALRLAQSARKDKLVSDIKGRLDLYKSNKPYTDH